MRPVRSIGNYSESEADKGDEEDEEDEEEDSYTSDSCVEMPKEERQAAPAASSQLQQDNDLHSAKATTSQAAPVEREKRAPEQAETRDKGIDQAKDRKSEKCAKVPI